MGSDTIFVLGFAICPTIASNMARLPALDDIRERGATIAANSGIMSKDALHVACAVEAKCDYFITTDRALLKKAQSLPEMKTVNPMDFAILMENTDEKRPPDSS